MSSRPRFSLGRPLRLVWLSSQSVSAGSMTIARANVVKLSWPAVRNVWFWTIMFCGSRTFFRSR